MMKPMMNDGTTSACAENTTWGFTPQHHRRNYLRVRGEYQKPHLSCAFSTELPPRARRIPPPKSDCYHTIGTTSACAENTLNPDHGGQPSRNYLRVRGEYRWVAGAAVLIGELPPRARRIRGEVGDFPLWIGTTSACAENTPLAYLNTKTHGNYLRVRGEYGAIEQDADIILELPPRARRILRLLCP